jgi:hypothetical protein
MHCRLRDQFNAVGLQGFRNLGNADQVKGVKVRVNEQEQALGRKTLKIGEGWKTEDFFAGCNLWTATPAWPWPKD